MIVYLVWTEFELSKKSPWLDEFRARFDKPYPYHLTLKNTSTIDPARVHDAEQRLSDIVRRYQPFPVTFGTYAFEKTENGHVIMVLADPCDSLLLLQKEVRESLQSFGPHVREDFFRFEFSFRPHITIGRKMSDAEFTEARALLPSQIACEAEIRGVTMIGGDRLLPDQTFEKTYERFFSFGV